LHDRLLTMRALARQEGYTLIDILFVAGLISVISAIALPITGSAITGQRFKGDVQALNNLVGLAKMRASAGFTRARVRANITDNTFLLERWNKTTSSWVAEGSTETLYRGVRFGFGAIGTPPPDTQDAIAQSPPCRVGILPGSAAIGNTACIVFNSRGLPIDGDGMLFGGHALYLTDGTAVQATTVTATPRIRLWWTPPTAARWNQQQ
jgi:type II secretory pathway pseudopilin PulG